MKTACCKIDMKLPSCNEYIQVCRTNPYKAAKYKKKIENEITLFINKLPKFDHPVTIEFHWVEKTKKRDLDNIAFAKKFILDALVKSGKLKDDNRKCVTAFSDFFAYSDKTCVFLVIKEDDGEEE